MRSTQETFLYSTCCNLGAEREGAELILHTGRILTNEKSCHRDVVTDYDKKVEKLVVKRLREAGV